MTECNDANPYIIFDRITIRFFFAKVDLNKILDKALLWNNWLYAGICCKKVNMKQSEIQISVLQQ